MRRNGGGAIALGPGGHRLDQLHVEVGRSKLKLVVARREEDVGEDRDGVPPLDHARHMAKRLGKGWFFYGKPHGRPLSRICASPRCVRLGRSAFWLRSGPGKGVIRRENSRSSCARSGVFCW